MNNQNQNQNQNINTNINTKEYKKNLRLQMKNLRIEFHKNQNDLYNQKTQIILDKVKNFILEFIKKNDLQTIKIAFTYPLFCEVNLLSLVEFFNKNYPKKIITSLPFVYQKNSELTFKTWNFGEELTPDIYNIPSPKNGEVITPNMLIIPLNAFDENNFRLGYGGGFYDRTIANNPQIFSVGVGFSFNKVKTIFPENFDIAMNKIIYD